ncbi:MAG: ATP-binding protein [bacterium]
MNIKGKETEGLVLEFDVARMFLAEEEEEEEEEASIVVSLKDVTERKKAEKVLQENKEFNRALFEYNPIETIIVDLEGKIIDFNLAKKVSGDRLPNIGDVMYSNYAAHHEIDMHAELMKCIKAGNGREFHEQKYKNRFLSITIAPFPKGAIITSLDITGHKEWTEKEKKRAIESQKAYEQLQASKDELIRSERLAFTGRIAANIAHEIRNPLTNVAMAVQQLRKAIKTEDPMSKNMDIIKRNTERINYLITELLNCARPPKLNIQPCNIHKVLEDILESNKTKITSKRIKIIKRFTSDTFIIKIDKEQMQRAFLNIIINAIEAMPKRGKLTIITEFKGNLFEVKIQDTGKGIPEEDIIRIFDPFFSSKSGGVGLGLTICYGIIVSHGGTIEVESKPKEGSIFMVSLPVS